MAEHDPSLLSAASPTNSPRVEAFAPDRDEELTEGQLRVVTGVRNLVDHWCALAERADNSRSPRAQIGAGGLRFGWLEESAEKRYAQVALIDGARGSGKTTALLRLRRVWASALRDSARASSLPNALRNTPLVVPLPILDLHPHPTAQSLLGVLVGTFAPLDRELASLEETIGPGLPAYLATAPLARERNRQRAWDGLFRAISSWDAHARQRSPRLSEDEYWRDLRDETARVSQLGDRFKSYIDALVDAWRTHHRHDHRSPLFAVLIDDADMHPSRSVELLHLIRTLSHPRVFFLLTGDSELFELMLRRDLWRTANVAQCMYTPSHGGMDDTDVTTFRQLAWDVLDRILPPAQRFQTAERPHWSTPSTASATPHAQLRASLDALARDSATRFMQYLFDESSGTPRFADAMPRRLRAALDLALLAQAAPRTAEGVEELLCWWWGSVLHGETAATEHALEHVVVRARPDQPEQLLLKRDERARWFAERRQGHVVTTEAAIGVWTCERLLYVWGGTRASPEVSSMLQLLNDVLVAQQRESLAPDNFESLVIAVWESRSEPRQVHWLLPSWIQFSTYLRFSSRLAWLLGTNLSTVTIDAMELLRFYFDAVIRAPLITETAASGVAAALSWSDIGPLMMKGKRAPGDDTITQKWLREESLLLLAPAYGLPQSGVQGFLENHVNLDSQVDKNALKRALEAKPDLMMGAAGSNADAFRKWLDQ